jgi:hypothetical protein
MHRLCGCIVVFADGCIVVFADNRFVTSTFFFPRLAGGGGKDGGVAGELAC